MFLQLGGEMLVSKKDIIAILDVKIQQSVSTKEFIQTFYGKGFVKHISEKGKEKSIVITNKNIYLSPISCATLKKRSMSKVSCEE